MAPHDSGHEPRDNAEHVTFLLAGQTWAVNAERVREVVAAPDIVAVPHAPVTVAGVLGLRGDVVCVLDPGPGLGLATRTTAPAAVLVVEAGSLTMGLAVDEVLDVVMLEVTSAGSTAADGIDSLGRLYQVLDVDHVAGGVVLEGRAS